LIDQSELNLSSSDAATQVANPSNPDEKRLKFPIGCFGNMRGWVPRLAVSHQRLALSPGTHYKPKTTELSSQTIETCSLYYQPHQNPCQNFDHNIIYKEANLTIANKRMSALLTPDANGLTSPKNKQRLNDLQEIKGKLNMDSKPPPEPPDTRMNSSLYNIITNLKKHCKKTFDTQPQFNPTLIRTPNITDQDEQGARRDDSSQEEKEEEDEEQEHDEQEEDNKIQEEQDNQDNEAKDEQKKGDKAPNAVNHSNSASSKDSHCNTIKISLVYRSSLDFNTHTRSYLFNITPIKYQQKEQFSPKYSARPVPKTQHITFNKTCFNYKYQPKHFSAYRPRYRNIRKVKTKRAILKFDSTLGYPGEGPPNEVAKYNIVSLNIGGAGTPVTEHKYRNLTTWMEEAKIDILCVQETRSFTNHRIADTITDSRSEFFVLEAPNTQCHTHGGVAIIYRKHVQLKLIGIDNETAWWDNYTHRN
jgi:hypothetical protein